MQTVTEELKKTLASQAPGYSRKVELYRQVWTGSEYVFDSAIDITAQLTDAGPIMWKLDKEGFNQWTLDNTTITVRNDRQQWKPGNPKGYFPTNYLLNNSKIKIYVGAQLADGTFERPQVFTGYIKQDPIKNSDSKNAVITLTGPMSIFEKFNAEDISTVVTNELLGSASGNTFTTDFNGVAGVSVVVKRGSTAAGVGYADVIKSTVDYTTSNADTKATPLTVVLIVDLTATESLWISYKYWYTDRTLEWLVEQVMILCGVSTYSITPAVFATNIPTTWTQTSQVDWEAGTLVNTDTTSVPGSFKPKWFLLDDFADLDFTSFRSWSTRVINDASISASAGYLRLASPGVNSSAEAFTPISKNTGTWRWRGWADIQRWDNGTGFWFFLQSNPIAITYYYGYGIKFRPADGHAYFARRWGDDYDEMYDLGAVTFSAWHEWRVTRNSSGEFKVYCDGSLRGTITDLTGTSSGWFGGCSVQSNEIRIDDIYVSDAMDGASAFDGTSASELVSQVEDMSVDLTSIGLLNATYDANGGTVTISTYTSGTSDFSADNDPAGWVQISNIGLILSAIKRYIKFKVVSTIPYQSYTVAPLISNIAVVYYTSSTTISLVNLTGMNCLSVLDSVAMKCNYERGFTAVDKFIFQPRSTTVPSVMDFKSSTNTFKLQNVVDGVDRVYNYITAQIGAYISVSSAEDDSSPNSIDKHDKRIYPVPSDALLPPENANLAYATTPTILDYTKNPRRRCQAPLTLSTYLELGDKVTLYYEEPSAFRSWKWGDTDVVCGQADLEYYDEAYKKARISFWAVDMRIEGIELYWFGSTRQTIFDLVEVL